MPDLYTHSKIAFEIVKKMNKTVDKRILAVGAQGPDPIYYNNFSKEAKHYREIADRMHDTKTQDFFISMLKYLKDNYTEDLYDYTIGFIAHYAADTVIHPYVYHKVGFYVKNDPIYNQYRGYHFNFERGIDAYLIKRDKKISPRKYNLTKIEMPLEVISPDVSKMYKHSLKEVYNFDEGDIVFDNSLKAMYFNVKYLIKDRFGIKTIIYKFLDLFIKMDLNLRDLTFFNRIKNVDYLNKNNQTWYHPITNEKSTKSVDELYEDAINRGIYLVDQVDKYLNDENHEELSKVFINLSYNSGIDCKLDQTMTNFNIFKKE
ncbi:hypothetical protein CI105_07710 [Candidatus Izimaplasma bacterium ZiA1]|uniref:zinc dependent phospholipase C family protein n=1 Tax=Candidatus Izimoplasma sp. ZiA1 TaxID=2024899 RepID=UPI000BAA3FA5|nr:hypothetical protein CI105_07710 [Candidatus Izimaplasma bacterium ZiA1]